ncbi:hypothetical protein OQZ33_23355 [Pedobacter sp. MC2016-05]|uniref:hypothetical protein n=1 Tax=Pedobacter sp. MC2016-05 TaxID=2994474 RepID=UPI002247F595|nr:hypothetical protein [Pedobacter sp. MC2016-05]MCX2477291.1 hypothetical protein [Pedobacter sp. MC2016-05]
MVFETNVFINCPFDLDYINDLLKPMIYSLIKNGLSPRLSLEVSDSGQIRLEKIINIIKECKYSIHDLSIVKSTAAAEFARMNMPFELGIDYGLRNSGVEPLDTKRFLILEAIKYDYQKALSDINGFDIKVHSNDTEAVFDCLYSWSSETLKLNGQDPPLKTYYDFADFNASLFEEKVAQFGSEKIAINYINRISIPEYIKEIRERI